MMSPAREFYGTARILIVEDDPAVQRVLEKLLRSNGFANVTRVPDALMALDLWATRPPDLALVDLHMPGTSGFEFLERIGELGTGGEFLPVIMLTGDTSPDVRRRALHLGAHDFLTKPFDTNEVVLRIRNLLRTRLLNRRLLETNSVLEARVRERTINLEEARREALDNLARAAEFRDDVTGHHTHRVGRLSAGIARELGWDEAEVSLLRNAAPLHDIGKIGIPDSILLKPGRLTPEEFDVMKRHTTIGAAILAGSRSPVFVLAQEIALTHHERWDGTGYPAGVGGEDIAVAGRIVCAADVFDALSNERPYKAAMPPREAFAWIEEQAGSHFDPAVAGALGRVLESYSPDLDT
ncbi:MAG TPA: HD domain-containing phosphohydrolase [Longimicrobiales bacterium]|nr:HD domain-containing phosphohydrolase [Longimicrobiales bacterium]